MDLDTIIMHLDNFVDTWNGWGDVFGGLHEAATSSFLGLFEGDEDNEGIFGTIQGLSSTLKGSSDALEASSTDFDVLKGSSETFTGSSDTGE